MLGAVDRVAGGCVVRGKLRERRVMVGDIAELILDWNAVAQSGREPIVCRNIARLCTILPLPTINTRSSRYGAKRAAKARC